MSEFTSFSEYRAASRDFMGGAKPDGVIDMIRPRDGATVRFDPSNGRFGVRTTDGVIRTFFRPDDGFEYLKKEFLS
jgi:pyocin large subunit-like protein